MLGVVGVVVLKKVVGNGKGDAVMEGIVREFGVVRRGVGEVWELTLKVGERMWDL